MKYLSLRWKNFLSYGKGWSEIDLNSNQMINIVGKNGRGKSVFIDAFHYVLTGKPFRDIKIPTIPNFINKKNCLVELEVERGRNKFLIRRGIGPKVFEIVKNGVPQDEDARSTDQQKILENLLGFNSKTIRFTTIMSSMKYTPFLKMSAAEKRIFIDEILDVSIFTELGTFIKKKFSILKEKLTKTEFEVNSLEKQLALIQEMNSKVIHNSEDQIEHVTKKIGELEQSLNKMVYEREGLFTEVENLNGVINGIEENRRKAILFITDKFDKSKNSLNKAHKKRLNVLKDEYTEKKAGLVEKGEAKEKNIAEKKKKLIDKIEETQLEIKKLKDELNKKRFEHEKALDRIANNKKTLSKKEGFLNDNSMCPTCERDIDDKFKDSALSDIHMALENLNADKEKLLSDFEQHLKSDAIIKKLKETYANLKTKLGEFEKNEAGFQKKYQESISKAKSAYEALVAKEKDDHHTSLIDIQEKQNNETNEAKSDTESLLSDSKTKRAEFNTKRDELKKTIEQTDSTISDYKAQIKRIKNNDNEVKDETGTLNDLNLMRKKLETQQYKKKIFESAILLLSDKGFKTTVVRKYIPLLNKYVNDYLEALETHYRLKFDDVLNCQIVERGYEKLSYDNFSSGEAARCDIALLFGFIDLAKKKNSVDSNLLILDEVADNSLDKTGVFGVINLINRLKLKGNTVYVISHRDEIKEMFDKTFEATKGVFSKLEEIE